MTGFHLFAISLMLFGGFTSHAIAKSKHRDAGVWFVFGALFPLIGIISAMFLSPAPAPAVKEA